MFDDLGPIKKNQFYFVGELGEENETKHLNAAQKAAFNKMHQKMLKEMNDMNEKYFPAKRTQSVLQKEKEAIMDDPLMPLGYSKNTY